ncbi:PBP1A family penicillin-binding protein [bacterium]|nr:PBP1A family penicillin-binding protein [bacterium]
MARKRRRNKMGGVARFFIFSGLFVAISGVLVAGLTIFILSKKLPDVKSMETYIPHETTKIYSVDNVILAELHQEENRNPVPLEDIAKVVIDAVIATEDTAFYEHHGINFKAILRAVYKDVKARAFVEGGSTLTQQLARNIFLTKRRTITRKVEEAILAFNIDRYYSKQEILELYLNQVYWGHNAYGIQSAAHMYFAKNAKDLKLGEAALLIGMLTGPELYSPFKNIKGSRRRQYIVLNRMAKIGMITQKLADATYEEELAFAQKKRHRYKAPFFTSYVVQQLIDMYGEDATYRSGMKVYTTLDYKLQQHADKIVKKYIKRGNKPYKIRGERYPSLNVREAAILSVEPSTGYIKVLQGGVNFDNNQFNRCLQSKRQPGSSFKPFVYLTALKKGFSPGKVFDDSPVTFNTTEGLYSPQNYSRTYKGKISMRRALELSVNVIAIKLNDLVGPASVIETARQLGLKADLKPILSLPLGAMEVTMLDLVTVYASFANKGRRVEPVGILRIMDRDGSTLYEHRHREQRVFNENKIAALVNMMKGVVKSGTGKLARLPGRPIAGKTGTTSDYRDAWFMGFVPQLVTGVWVGNDDNSSMVKMTGGWFPAQMWKEFMKEALKGVPSRDFSAPRGMVVREINWDTGLLSSDFSPKKRVFKEKFWKGKEPTKKDTPLSLNIIKQKEENAEESKEEILDFFN